MNRNLKLGLSGAGRWQGPIPFVLGSPGGFVGGFFAGVLADRSAAWVSGNCEALGNGPRNMERACGVAWPPLKINHLLR